MKTAKTTKTTKTAEAAIAEVLPAPEATEAQKAAPKAMSQWCNTASTRRQYAHPDAAEVAWGKAITAKPGTARHVALVAMQSAVEASGTWGAVYSVAATNWVHWAKAEGYLVAVGA